MKQALFTLLAFAGPVLADECLTYSGEVTLRGTLSKQTFPEQPNYKSISDGDKSSSYFFVLPTVALCVTAGDRVNNEQAESKVAAVQLVFPVKEDGYGPLRPYLNKQVECRGKLFHAVSGHHHSPVLLGEARCHAA
jgi:hypothetical protein